MTCSTCSNECLIVLADRAFCEECFDKLRKAYENYQKDATQNGERG